jgi:ribonuclease E
VLESSTEKCPHCGGTGHVRSVSSVALQLLRSIEEMLLKGPTHNLIIRTRPEIALYVLNHKRAHLRGLEERFKVTLTVNADEEVGGQIGFTIDRGEQVMTIEQARILLAQAAADAPALHEDEEPEFPEEVDEEPEAEAGEGESAAHSSHVESQVEEVDEGSDDEPSAQADSGREGGRDGEGRERGGRGRSRRRRRGRGGREGHEGGPSQPRYDQGSPERSDLGHGSAQGFAPAGDQEQPAGDMPSQQDFAQPHPENGEARGNGGDEPRRRRRGRRGGRRNRREDGPNGDFAAAPGAEVHERPDYSERPDWSPPRETAPSDTGAPSESAAPPPFDAAPLPPQPAPAPQASAPAASAEPLRRRSTVREPAPVFSGSAPVVTPPPAPQPPPVPTVVSTGADESKPKRSGWWAKKLLGG